MERNELELQPLSMFTITANLMTHVKIAIENKYGKDGVSLFNEGVEAFREEQKELIMIDDVNTEKESEALFDSNTILQEEKVESIYKKFAEAQLALRIEKTISIYGLMAKVFAHVSKRLVDTYGEQGEDVIRQGVEAFGVERGKGIAARAASQGKPNTMENYLTYYDMGRSDLFEYETVYHPTEIEQTFTTCAFGGQWKEDGMGKYGILYCQMIDPSIAKGYNPNFEVVHDEYVLREGQCHFLFQMKETNGEDQTS